jgi:hypothetical protein
MYKALFLAVIVLLAAACSSDNSELPTPTPPSPPSALDLFQRYVAAMNAANIEAAVALFSTDAILEPGGPGGGGRCQGARCVGRDAIRAQLQGQISDQHKLTFVSGGVAGDDASGYYELRSRMTAASGTERLIFEFRVQTRSSQINAMAFTPNLNDPATASFFEGRRGMPTQGQ